MNKLWVLVFIFYSLIAQSETWNHVLSEHSGLQFTPDFPQPMLPLNLDGKLIFKGNSRGNEGLWSYDTLTNELNDLVQPQSNLIVSGLLKHNDNAYFLIRQADQSQYFQLWKTNGTREETLQVSDVDIFGYGGSEPLIVNEGILFTRGPNGIVYEIKNDQVTTHSLQLDDVFLNIMCVFGDNDFITYDYFDNRQVVRVQGATSSFLNDSLPSGFRVTKMVDINNDCYIHYTIGFDFNGPFGILKVSQDGDTQLFSEQVGLDKVYEVFSHKGKKLAFRNNQDENNSSSLITLSEDDSVLAAELTLDNGSFSEYISTKNDLMINFVEQTTGVFSHYFIDDAFNLTLVRAEKHLTLPHYLPSESSEILVYDNQDTPGNFDLISINQNGIKTSFQSKEFDFIEGVSSSDGDGLYFILRERETGTVSFYSMDELPNIGQSLTGAWFDPALKNQGLVIRQGVRNLGSTYIFATLYTYRNGQPLWLAGDANYLPGQASVQINLFDFQGTNFLELVEEPSRNEFGTITITPNGCNSLHVNLINNDSNFDFNFVRIDNTVYQKYCLEPTQSVTK